jgi:hypothetical protein
MQSSEQEAKIDACTSALMVVVGLLHEQGVLSGGAIARAWSQHAHALTAEQLDTGYWLAALAGKLDRVSKKWPEPGTRRPW